MARRTKAKPTRRKTGRDKLIGQYYGNISVFRFMRGDQVGIRFEVYEEMSEHTKSNCINFFNEDEEEEKEDD